MNSSLVQNQSLNRLLKVFRFQRGSTFGLIIITALLAFEVFNYSTTDFALADLLGDLNFLGIRWATILAIAFCGIDFAGIARLFTPEEGADEPTEVWYLFGAWLLAATMNAMLTWWGVSIAILNHESLGNAVIARDVLLRAVPIFVAVMVWLIRVLIIGTFSVAGERLFSQADKRAPRFGSSVALPAATRSLSTRSIQASASRNVTKTQNAPTPTARPPRPAPKPEPTYSRQEPTYHPVMSAKPSRAASSHTRR